MGTGEKRALDAATQATSSPLLETTLEGARVDPAVDHRRHATSRCGRSTRPRSAVQETAHPDANIIFGAMVDEKLEDEVWVTVVATGYSATPSRAPRGGGLREPIGEPRVTRTREREPARAAARSTDVDVPEFIPRF